MARVVVVCLLSALLSPFAFAQSDPQALAFAAQSIAALTGGTTVSDVTLSGSVTRTAGSDTQTGTATLYGKGQNEGRLNLSLDNGQRSEIRNYLGTPQGEWIGPDGIASQFAQFNCMTDAVWFFPALSSLAFANDSNQTLSYVGFETLNGTPVQHLRSIWYGQQFSQMDLYLDSTSLLPIAVGLNAHADTDSSLSIPIQVQFSNYQNAGGVLVPFHVQQFLNGSLLLDVVLDGVALNSGLTDDLFTIQ